MAVFHVNSSYISKGGSASGFANYLHRLHDDQATQLRRYIDREGRGHDDLIASGHDHLPAWAHGDDHSFWLTADRHERKNGVVARVVELALPRELSPQAQRDLTDDIRQTFFSEHAHSWGIHAPAARDGSGVQPHLHVMFSTRTNDEHDRSPQQYFRRYNPTHPAQGGAKKERSWDTKGRLQDLRWGVATLTNAALEREGIPLAVTHLSLRRQGLDRDPARYANPHNDLEKATVQTYRDRLHQGGEKDFELELIRAAWSQQKTREHLHSLDRQSVLDHVRDHVWRYDRSPQRELERQQSFTRSLERSQPALTLERAHTVQRTPQQRITRTPTRELGRTLQGLAATLDRGDEQVGGATFRPRLHDHDREREEERGLSW